MKAAIIGYGKMGHEIERILLERGHSVELIIDQYNVDLLCHEKLQGIDVAIEFTTPQTAYANIRTCIEAGVAVVSGTTGWTERLPELQALCRERGSAMIYSSNYSLGVNIAFRLNRRLDELMNGCNNYDVAIEEIHHTQKKDAPSGTAITLANDIIERVERKSEWHCIEPQKGEQSHTTAASIEITSLREGAVPGTHTVTYTSADDVLELKHTLKSRSALATGAVIAAEFVCGKSGVFTMDDILKV
ncbi:MAG: 4-hydroxy-tetrahydrodipicolinate reductase [Alistipes sp.]|nr:4-hydroxy-tetrahydrodipicolinate reductase [Alistipes sp.]